MYKLKAVKRQVCFICYSRLDGGDGSRGWERTGGWLGSRLTQIFHGRTGYFVLAVYIFKQIKKIFRKRNFEGRIWALYHNKSFGKNPFQLQKLKLILYRNCVDNFSVTCIRPTYIINPFKPSVP